MFILYAIPIGIIAGYLMGGRLDGLAEVRFRWGWLAIAGLAIQVLLFSGPVAASIGEAGRPIYLASTAAVFIAVLRNVQIPGIALIALGAGSNLLAIVANGGLMPASPGAVEALGVPDGPGFSNSVILADPALAPLTDVFALPPWVPFANVFSIGDVLIGLGVAVVIALGMRRRTAPTG